MSNSVGKQGTMFNVSFAFYYYAPSVHFASNSCKCPKLNLQAPGAFFGFNATKWTRHRRITNIPKTFFKYIIESLAKKTNLKLTDLLLLVYNRTVAVLRK